MYTIYSNCTESEIAAVKATAHGCYQAALLEGYEAWSGATLRGKAASYGYHYARSRRNLIGRVYTVARTLGVSATEERRAHGKRVVVIRGSVALGISNAGGAL